MKFSKILFALIFGMTLLLSNTVFAQHEGEHNEAKHEEHSKDAKSHKKGFDVEATAFHHIADANVYSIGPWSFPLPCILYDKDRGKFSVFSSGKFHIHGAHGDGTEIVDGYVLNGGTVMKIANPTPEMLSEEGVEIHTQDIHPYKHEHEDKEKSYFMHNGKRYDLIKKTTLDGGIFKGGFTSFYDFSLTKNVVSMILVCLFLLFTFFGIAKSYKNGVGKAPRGIQGLFEPMIVFIRDEVAKPFLGKKWKKFLPFLLTIFFFILGLNLFGQIPFFGGSNVTGNLSVTFVLAIFAFFVVNLSGNAHYWKHIVWMPGVPAWLKIFILTPVEIIGVFIKPLTLMLRLFANITAGHMVMVIFVSLIFIAKDAAGEGMALGTAIGSTLLTLFMMSIELLVAFIQAFVFTILTAAYLSASTEEAHEHDHAEAAAH
ncbi:MAG TPA: ATP synthase F0 subunit A [Phaeodactylibacter sp.]|nr:ATP synthase F0 subunit A [Phaeodactylibacter sp.]